MIHLPFLCAGCKTLLGVSTRTELILGSFGSLCSCCGMAQEDRPILIQRKLITFYCYKCGEVNKWEPNSPERLKEIFQKELDYSLSPR